MVRSVSLILAVFLAVFLTASAARAQTQYSQENNAEDRACRADAHRFCKDDIPDQFKVGSCLQAHRDRLSRPCKAMLESHGM